MEGSNVGAAKAEIFRRINVLEVRTAEDRRTLEHVERELAGIRKRLDQAVIGLALVAISAVGTIAIELVRFILA